MEIQIFYNVRAKEVLLNLKNKNENHTFAIGDMRGIDTEPFELDKKTLKMLRDMINDELNDEK